MRKAIETKYFGPTTFKGSRIQAKAADIGAIFLDRQHANIDQEHCKAAKALAEKYNWPGLWVAGGKPDATGNVYVCLPFSAEWSEGYAASVVDGPQGEDWFFVASQEQKP